ncbi:hypothetical protein QOZ88_04145 [Blastococcus sp. BMG 814]|uniref:DUF1508 domain-containing protein n=1 Tax=Blastococcus carthaginiensis TaxID=3050034 RepID=A0ABT9I8D4_9ACTN|nr:hypothetical protein [Blastococcus carthaginiensis]MDP5181818.1 hypothetical protein [Blastococcus carthaginiensis]
MSEHVEVWRQPAGSWRWRYVGAEDGGGTVELPSHSSEATCEAAVDAARTAYPGLTVVVDRSSADDAAADGAAWRARWLGAALVVFLVAVRRHGVRTAAVVVVAALAVTARDRRGARTGGSAA